MGTATRRGSRVGAGGLSARFRPARAGPRGGAARAAADPMLDRSVSTRSTRATATAKRNRVGPRASAPRPAARSIGRARANFLQRPHAILVEWPCPSQRAHMTVRVSGDRELGNDGSGRRVDPSQRMGALVSVRPDHDHVPPPLQRERHRRDGSPVDRPPVKARCQAPIKSRARCSVGGRLQTSFRSDVRRDTLESAAAAREPTGPVGQTAEPTGTMTLTTRSAGAGWLRRASEPARRHGVNTAGATVCSICLVSPTISTGSVGQLSCVLRLQSRAAATATCSVQAAVRAQLARTSRRMSRSLGLRPSRAWRGP